MPTTISEAFDLPRPDDIRAMKFVIRLSDLDPTGEEVGQLVRDYVVTPAVAHELPVIFSQMRQVQDRGEEYGRFIHGSFGSGKSHFMTVLSLMLEDADVAWQKDSPVFAQLAKEHRGWIHRANLLVVRLHMLSARGRGSRLDRLVYEAFNEALKHRGKAAFEFLDTAAVLDEIRREVEAYGDLAWTRLRDANVIDGKADFDRLSAGSARQRETLAKAWLTFKGRDAGTSGIERRWTEGLARMADHAKAQGFGGIVLVVDEFLLWLAEKSGQEFVSEINDLNTIVDHATGQRAVPIYAFVARQRNIQEFFPDLVDESKIYEHIDHHSKRFDTTRLQDIELRHVVKGRVLRAKREAEVKAAVNGLAEKHKDILPGVLAGADVEYLKDVYPFHPALIEMLVDVTSLMQRERTALKLLYELLVIHHPDLPLGEFIPVGSAFDALFPPAGVEASKKIEIVQDIHRQYYERLAPAMKRMVEDSSTGLDESRKKALDQIVKTVLLGELSPRLKGGGLSIERLVQLNSADVEGERMRERARVALSDLLALQKLVPDLQVAGTDRAALVTYLLGRVSLGEILGRARSKVDNPSQRFKVLWPALKRALGLDALKGFEDGGLNRGDWDLTWRKTKRRGCIRLGNVREMPYEDFDAPEGAFTILVDYPWDDPGHTVQEDRDRALKVRENRGLRYSAAWLPRHFTTGEIGTLTDLAAVKYLRSETGQAELLETLAQPDKVKVLEQASVRERTLAESLDALLLIVYKEHGELVALVSDVATTLPRETLAQNLEYAATLLLDRRYPQHPHFGAEPRKQDLERLLDWLLTAGDTSASVAFDDDTGRVLKTLGQPLELVNLGQTKASVRLDTRYIKEVLSRTDKDTVSWGPVADWLRESFGLQQHVVDLFLCFLCGRNHRALTEFDSSPLDASIGMPPSTRVKLERGKLVEPAQWSRLRDLAADLFGLPRPTSHRTLKAQDRLAADLRAAADSRRSALMGLHERLVRLQLREGAARLKQIGDANAGLAPLTAATTDSHTSLVAFLQQWPAEGTDPRRDVVRKAEALRSAVNTVDDNALHNLRAGAQDPTSGVDVQGHVAALFGRLEGTQEEQPLAEDWVRGWNQQAHVLVRALLGRGGAPPSPVPPGGGPIPGPPPLVPLKPPDPSLVLCEGTMDPSDRAAVDSFLDRARKALATLPRGKVRVRFVRDEDHDA